MIPLHSKTIVLVRDNTESILKNTATIRYTQKKQS